MNPAEMQIQHISPDDPDFVHWLVDYLKETEGDLDPADAWRDYFDWMMEQPEAGQRHLWWAVVDGRRVGFAHLRLAPHPVYTDELVGEVADIYIQPAYRRRGYGGELARRCLAALREWANLIAVDVPVDLPDALAFWRSIGFELVNYHLQLPYSDSIN